MKKTMSRIFAVLLSLIFLTIFTGAAAVAQPLPPEPDTSAAILSISLEHIASEDAESEGSFDTVVTVEVTGIELVDKIGEENVPGEGHLIYYWGAEPAVIPTWPAYTEDGSYEVSAETTYTWQDSFTDYTAYAVQIVNNDDTPLNPAVYAVIRTFETAEEDSGLPMIHSFDIEISDPAADGASFNTTLATVISGFNIVDNIGGEAVDGEGHYMYFNVVAPETAPGQSAFLPGDYAYPTTFMPFTWMQEPAGYTTYAVQLVNNDYTPLLLPVFAMIKTNVYPGVSGLDNEDGEISL